MDDLFQIDRDEHGRITRVGVDLAPVAIVIFLLAVGLHWVFS